VAGERKLLVYDFFFQIDNLYWCLTSYYPYTEASDKVSINYPRFKLQVTLLKKWCMTTCTVHKTFNRGYYISSRHIRYMIYVNCKSTISFLWCWWLKTLIFPQIYNYQVFILIVQRYPTYAVVLLHHYT
jgi:hypothetical protein